MNEPLTIDDRTIKAIRARILQWGRNNFQHYPWRTERNPWLTLVAEIMLQRTRASQVAPVFERFASAYPSPELFLNAGNHAAQATTSQLGVHNRGRVLLRVAERLSDPDQPLPSTLAELTAIDGVGPYTAAAWLSLHRGIRAPIIDSNVYRWLGRVTGNPYQRDPRGVTWLADLANRLTPARRFTEYNYAVLDFTMMVCTPRAPRCPECPVRRYCAFGRGAVPGDQRQSSSEPLRARA